MTALDFSKHNQSRWLSWPYWDPNKGAGWYPVLTMPRNPRLSPCIPYAAYWDGKLFKETSKPGSLQNKEVIFFLNERFDKSTDAIDLANDPVNDTLPESFLRAVSA